MPFNERLEGLLANPAFNLGMGLLSAGGPNAANPSSGQRLAQATQFAGGRQQQLAQNDFLRSRLDSERQQQEAFQRQMEAQQQLQGLFGRNEMVSIPSAVPDPVGLDGQSLGQIGDFRVAVPAVNTPQGQRELQGLLGTLAPNALAQSMLAQPRAEPADIRTMRELGIPITPEGFQSYSNIKNAGTELDTMLQIAQLDAVNRDAREEARVRAVAMRRVKNSVEGSFDELRNMVMANNVIRGGALRTGNPLNEMFASIGSLGRLAFDTAGLDTTDIDRQLENYSLYNKASSRLQSNLANAASSSTNMRLGLIEQSTATLATDPAAVNAIAVSTIKELLRAADTEGIVGGENGISQEEVREMEDFVFTMEARPDVISLMPRRDLERLDLSVLDPQMLPLVRERLIALGGQ